MVTLALDEKIVAPTKKKRGMLPILIVLFLISYGLMSTLVVEQGRTIESQRSLIHDLFNDSSELSALKMKEVFHGRGMTAPPAKTGDRTETAPIQVVPQENGKKNKAAKARRPVVERPPKPAADTADSRRIPLTI
ncbi:MAG: hypothetical protein ACRD2U_08835 [Terriglobales bacterium]